MTMQRKRYTAEFKRETVQLMENSGKPVAQLARDLDVDENNLYRWRSQLGTAPTGGTGQLSSMAQLAAEIKRLQRENEVLRQEREILKKAMNIVSRSQL
jgi:transposase